MSHQFKEMKFPTFIDSRDSSEAVFRCLEAKQQCHDAASPTVVSRTWNGSLALPLPLMPLTDSYSLDSATKGLQ